MKNLLFGVILGLLAVALSTPVEILDVTQIPTKPDDDVLKEVLEDGYLVDEMIPRVLTTNPPRTTTTVPASQQPTSDSKHGEIEGSAAEATAEASTTPTLKESNANETNVIKSDDSTSKEAADSGSVSTTTEAPHQPTSDSEHVEVVGSAAEATTEPSAKTTKSDDPILVEVAADSGSVSTTTEAPQQPTSDSEHVEGNNSAAEATTEPSAKTTKLDGPILVEVPADSGSVSTTTQAPQQPTSDSEHVEGNDSAAEATAEPSTTPTLKESDADETNATKSENSTAADSTNSHNSHPKFNSTSVPPKVASIPFETNQTSDIEDSSAELSGSGGYASGSGDIQSFVTIASRTTSSGLTKDQTSSTASPVIQDLDHQPKPGAKYEVESELESETMSYSDKHSEEPSATESGEPSDKESETESSTKSGSKNSRMFGAAGAGMATQQQGHDKVINEQSPTPNAQHGRTPGWIIIVAFIVGLAALVMLCVAIATRDKWNGPPKSSQAASKSSSSDEQREQEMTTFVSKESPRENGKASEYTVIPLDELPEDYSSH